MEKAFLIIDMPDSCYDCDLCHTKDFDYTKKIDGDKFCGIEDMEVSDYCFNNMKPNWCPLKLLPKKKVVLPTDNIGAVAVKYGWNNCIDKILEDKS